MTIGQSPSQYGHEQARWQLDTIGESVRWMKGMTISGISKMIKRLGFSKKKAKSFTRSPDPSYREKWRRITDAYADSVAHPSQVALLFQDEITYYRKAEIKDQWQARGSKEEKIIHHFGANTKARVTGALNAMTGQLNSMQRAKVGINELCLFYGQIRDTYPNEAKIYLVQDNWPIHKHPKVMEALSQNRITPLFLPTYASWLNPIEKVWRWLRQEVLHNHRHSKTFKSLREEVMTWLNQFEEGSKELLHYVGLLSKEELIL